MWTRQTMKALAREFLSQPETSVEHPKESQAAFTDHTGRARRYLAGAPRFCTRLPVPIIVRGGSNRALLSKLQN